jgi:phosphomannomutase/phosphoglucomutase
MGRLFGTAGLRGFTNSEVDSVMAAKIGAAWGTYLGSKGKVGVGRDTRFGAQMIAEAASAGLFSTGLNTVDCGIIPTGGLASFVRGEGLAGGLLITGSHMPHDRIGIILMLPDGGYIPEDVAIKVEDVFFSFDRLVKKVPCERIGSREAAERPIERYIEFLKSCADPAKIRGKKFKVLVDPCNGAAGPVLPRLLRELGCEVHELNTEMRPVPARHPEPRVHNLGPTAAEVVRRNCDIGVATDIDADRVLFIDAAGNVMSEDLMGALFAEETLKASDRRLCVTPINSSGLIELVCNRIGGRVEYCLVGQPATVKAIKELGAVFSYEESGKYYFCRDALWCDGLIATVKLLGVMARTELPLADLAARFPKFHQVKHTVACPDDKKAGIMDAVRKIWEGRASEGRVRDLTIDGLKRMYEDNSWLLIRKSGTEPLIRVYSDAMSLQRAEELVKAGEEILGEAMKSM